MKERLKKVPLKPGVYLYKDREGKVLYVGKAKLLRNRMRSYFQASHNLHPKVKALMNRVADFDFIVTGSEMEALLLENNLIKAYQPRYNIHLRDDKTYPYLKLSLGDAYPRLTVAREEKDGISKYYGPYADVGSLRETLRVLNGVFPLRNCKTWGRRERACLNHDIGKCLGPCTGQVSDEEYRGIVNRLMAFMEGDYQDLVKEAEARMREAAARMDYEKAARWRDQVQNIKKLGQKQQVFLEQPLNLDIISMLNSERTALAMIFKIRQGRLISKESFWLTRVMDEGEDELMEFLLRAHYEKTTDLGEILVSHLPCNHQLLVNWLKELAGRRVEIKSPRKGEKKRLLEMVESNARLLLEERLSQEDKRKKTLRNLSASLELEIVPERIECFDISHMGGSETVGSMVVFTNAVPDKKAYRRFKLSQEQNDDYLSLAEVLKRRFEEARQGNPHFLPQPDLLVIDGGLGQLHAAQQVLYSMEIDICLISLAKKKEEIFIPGRDNSIILPRRDEGLQLLQQLRDEAHRFAISYNRQRRSRKLTQSALDDIPGVGTQRKKALLQHFGSLNRIRAASPEEIAAAVPGISLKLAGEISIFLHRPEKT